MDNHSLHQHVFGLRPKQDIKPSTFWVAVLKAGVELSRETTEEDFLWLKCPGSTKIRTIREQYEKKYPTIRAIKLNIQTTIDDHVLIRELNHSNDQLVVLEVIEATGPSPHVVNGRSPLRSMNNQLRSPPPSNQSQEPEAKFPNMASNINTPDENRDLKTNFQSSALPPYHTPAINSTVSQDSKPESAYAKKKNSQFVKANFPNPNTNINVQDEQRGPQTGCQSAAPLSHLAPASMPPDPSAPKVESSSPAAATVIRPDWATSNGFNYYLAQIQDKTGRKMIGLDSAQVQELRRDSWLKLSSEQRQSFEDLAKQNSGERNVKLAPIQAELTVKDLLPIDQSIMGLSEIEDHSRESIQLQKLLTGATPDLLETGVEEGVRLLDTLKSQMLTDTTASTDTSQWIQQIDTLRGQAVKTRTVIGVVGNTGAGKSSVINAMLDEERLLPTNCMRACTAVVTEISYNEGDKPYRAKIEFIKPSDWEKELKTLFQDLVDGSGNVSRESSNPDTDAGIAYAKIKAVYPKKTKETIPQSSIEKMLDEVSHILGSSRDIEETDSSRFYNRLQQFVDSKEKLTGEKDKEKKKERREMEFWPLIRVVRIYVKSPALSTGAVICDLPGCADSNAARAAVAENYMKECTGLWIVAPITRAVDDKAAKSLLGESFKRQLKMDGGFSTVTFICSKTDDISLMEAQESLGLDEEMGDSWLEKEEYCKKAKALNKELDQLKDSRIVYSELYNDADEKIEVWESLKSSIEDGKVCFSPKSKALNKKRKGNTSGGARKKQRRSEKDDTFDEDSEDSQESDEDIQDSSEEEESREPLTEERITEKIRELRETKREAKLQKAELADKMTSIRKEISKANAAEKKVEARMSALCISGRNQYSKGAIQHDFAAGIRELDQEMAADEDEENFDPESDLRDYDEVARSLPVFCVSSRGYQKLQGRLRKDPNVPGFETIEETEIPQLQAHCKQLTGKGRIANCQRFINNLSQLLNSLAIWASNDGTGTNMTPEQKAREERYLQKGLKELESGLDKAVQATSADLEEEFTSHIFDKYESAIAAAAVQASQIAHKWGSPVNRENRSAGGYCWSTYKAICRRMGVYSNAQGPHEWNRDLIEPMMKLLVSGWEKTFSRRLPVVMTIFTRETSKLLKAFHGDVNSRASKVGAGVAGLRMLQQQLGVYENIINDLATTVKGTINTTQKDINREFTPVIEKAMTAAYDACVAEAGPGSYARMKSAMNAHVNQERHTMFQQSADEAHRRLVVMIQEAGEIISDRLDEVFVAMRRDYRSVLGGGDNQGEMLSKSQRLLRKQVKITLEQVEELFKKALGQAADRDEEAEVKAENLDERKEDQVLHAETASFEPSRADDTADRKVKLEPVEDHDASMLDVSGSGICGEDKTVSNDGNVPKDDPSVPSKHLSTSNNQVTAKTEFDCEQTENGVHRSWLDGHYEEEKHMSPNDQQHDQQDFESTLTHTADQEDVPIAPGQNNDKMDSFDSFTLSEH